ncbi:hypothetical protein [Halorussus caseinilyticus]|uniref:Uncharacterized protein n=1 Tax=Halorussus caseinilyticus TaxID=3034025 RepID=A0ABD5WLX4_9EURY
MWRIPDGGFADAFYVSVDGRNVTIVNAPTVEQLSEVRPDVGPIATTDATNETDAGDETTTEDESVSIEVETNATTTTADG